MSFFVDETLWLVAYFLLSNVQYLEEVRQMLYMEKVI